MDACVINRAAEAGKIEVLEWARDNGIPWGTGTSLAVRSANPIPTMKWLLANGCPIDARATAQAICRSDFELAKWLRDNGGPWNPEVAKIVAKNCILLRSRLEELPLRERQRMEALSGAGPRPQPPPGVPPALKWIAENGCPFDETFCEELAKKGRLNILRWARNLQCPWDKRTIVGAEAAGWKDVAAWAREHGCPTS